MPDHADGPFPLGLAPAETGLPAAAMPPGNGQALRGARCFACRSCPSAVPVGKGGSGGHAMNGGQRMGASELR